MALAGLEAILAGFNCFGPGLGGSFQAVREKIVRNPRNFPITPGVFPVRGFRIQVGAQPRGVQLEIGDGYSSGVIVKSGMHVCMCVCILNLEIRVGPMRCF